jgi:hypothetical protein
MLRMINNREYPNQCKIRTCHNDLILNFIIKASENDDRKRGLLSPYLELQKKKISIVKKLLRKGFLNF